MVKLKDGVVEGAPAIKTMTTFICYSLDLSLFKSFMSVAIVAFFAIAMSSLFGFPIVELFLCFVYFTARTDHLNTKYAPVAQQDRAMAS